MKEDGGGASRADPDKQEGLSKVSNVVVSSGELVDSRTFQTAVAPRTDRLDRPFKHFHELFTTTQQFSLQHIVHYGIFQD